MKFLAFSMQFVRLPLDFILLTFHYLRAIWWLIYNGLKRKMAGKPEDWPFKCFTQETSSGDYACIPGRKYGNLFLFRSLCPDAKRETGLPCSQTSCTENLQLT